MKPPEDDYPRHIISVKVNDNRKDIDENPIIEGEVDFVTEPDNSPKTIFELSSGHELVLYWESKPWKEIKEVG